MQILYIIYLEGVYSGATLHLVQGPGAKRCMKECKVYKKEMKIDYKYIVIKQFKPPCIYLRKLRVFNAVFE